MILCSEEKRRELSLVFNQAYHVDCTNCKKEKCLSFRRENNFPLKHVWCPSIEPKVETELIKKYKRLLSEWKKEEEELIRTTQISKSATGAVKEPKQLEVMEIIDRTFDMYAPKFVTIDEDGYLRVEHTK